jgi:hypothetical protein
MSNTIGTCVQRNIFYDLHYLHDCLNYLHESILFYFYVSESSIFIDLYMFAHALFLYLYFNKCHCQ